jgi:hypothetical protein
MAWEERFLFFSLEVLRGCDKKQLLSLVCCAKIPDEDFSGQKQNAIDDKSVIY